MLSITALSHLDHGLTAAHLRFILDHGRDWNAFTISTLVLPEEFQQLPCGLYGPCLGDAPVPDSEVVLVPRSGRAYPSRLVDRPSRPTRLLTVIAGPHTQLECMLYTAFGGPSAPREPGDLSLEGPNMAAAKAEAEAFWATHALAK